MRLRGSPKNMNQGIYWVQRSVSQQRTQKRKIGPYNLYWNEDHCLAAYNDNGLLPKKYVTNWILENESEAILFAQERILHINKNNRVDYRLAIYGKSKVDAHLNLPINPTIVPIPKKKEFKDNILFGLPIIGRVLHDKRKKICERNSVDIINTIAINEAAKESYINELQTWEQENKITLLEKTNIPKIISLTASFLEMEFPRWYTSSIKLNGNVFLFPLIRYEFDTKRPSGVTKSLSKITFKNKTTKELLAEQMRASIVIALSFYKFVYAFGYKDEFLFEISSMQQAYQYKVDIKGAEKILNIIGCENFDYDLDFLREFQCENH